MKNEITILNEDQIQNKIHTIRGIQVMFDKDLAELYGVASKRLNEQVKRNINRFPQKFRFQLTEEEYKSINLKNTLDDKEQNLRSQFATSSFKHGGRRYLPYVFTEQGEYNNLDVIISVSELVKESTVRKFRIVQNEGEKLSITGIQ